MAVGGYYLATRVSHTLVPMIRAYARLFREQFLPAFEDLPRRAEEIADAEFAKLMAEPPGNGMEDPGHVAEVANGRAQGFYNTMVALRQTSLNIFAAGLYHLLEQQVAALGEDATFQAMGVPVPDTSLSAAAEWYRRHLRLDLSGLQHWPKVYNELRLVANAVKHGEGWSANDLRAARPELFTDRRLRELGPDLWQVPRRLSAPLAGEGLFVTPAIFEEYAEAAIGLLDEVQEHFVQHQDDEYPDVV